MAPTPLEAGQVVSIQSNAYRRHLAEWIAQWEGILQGYNKIARFSRSPGPA